MVRAPFQVLVFPWRPRGSEFEFAIFLRADDGVWQAISGGGEDGETPIEAAAREALEEAGIDPASTFLQLDSLAMLPVTSIRESPNWGEDVYVIPEYSFGVQVEGSTLWFGTEHVDRVWVSFEDASRLLRYDSNRIALWELNQRIRGLGPRETPPSSTDGDGRGDP